MLTGPHGAQDLPVRAVWLPGQQDGDPGGRRANPVGAWLLWQSGQREGSRWSVSTETKPRLTTNSNTIPCFTHSFPLFEVGWDTSTPATEDTSICLSAATTDTTTSFVPSSLRSSPCVVWGTCSSTSTAASIWPPLKSELTPLRSCSIATSLLMPLFILPLFSDSSPFSLTPPPE